MKEEYNYTLTVPLHDTDKAVTLLEEVKKNNPRMRLSRKPDTKKSARFYLSFPFSGARTDTGFHEWFLARKPEEWDLYGPNYGVWGFN